MKSNSPAMVGRVTADGRDPKRPKHTATFPAGHIGYIVYVAGGGVGGLLHRHPLPSLSAPFLFLNIRTEKNRRIETGASRVCGDPTPPPGNIHYVPYVH